MVFRLVVKVAVFVVGGKKKNGALAMWFRNVMYGCVMAGSRCKFARWRCVYEMMKPFSSLSFLLLFGLLSAPVCTVQASIAVRSVDGEKVARHEFTVHASEPLQQMSKRLKIGSFDPFEHPTGLHFSKGELVTVSMKGKPSTPVKLHVISFGKHKPEGDVYELEAGEVSFRPEHDGLAYIDYTADDFKAAPPVKVTIEGGKMNGVFTEKSSNEEWKKMLAGASSPYLDLYGKYVHLVFPVQALREHCPENGAELLALYDRLIGAELKVIGMGYKNERTPNHVFGRVVDSGYMFADGMGAGFNDKAIALVTDMKKLLDPKYLEAGFWGIAHEFGHVLQTRPGFKWLGMTEVTNNLLAMVASYEVDPRLLRLEVLPCNDGHARLKGGRYNLFTKSALIDKELYQLQARGDTGHSHVTGGDVFVRLIPLWQLYLYCQEAGQGNRDFYPEFHAWLRTEGKDDVSAGQHQLNFMREACRINKLDLSDYFEAVGMLKPIDVEFKDYGTGRLKMTAEECAEVKKEASKYPKPASPVIQYMNANNMACYRDRLPLAGPSQPGQGVKLEKERCMVDHGVWKNAVAYEVYEGGKLVGITLSGVGSDGNVSTNVHFPETATEIKAVGWDGSRKSVLSR